MLSSVALLKTPKEINNYYLLYLLRAPYFYSLMRDDMSGVAITRVTLTKLSKALIPIAPLAEQKRIVEKCDRLLSFCNQMEVRQQQRQESIVRMNESAIAQLLSSQNPDEFSQHWQRICNNFDLLYSIPETIPKLRQAILQLAVQGKLVPQTPNDEPASVLLEKIRAEMERLAREGKFRKNEIAYQKINSQSQPPEGWIWTELGEFVELISGQHLGKDEQDDKEEGLPYLTGPADFGEVNPVATRWTMTLKAIAERNDILITVKGAGVGKANVLGMEKAVIGRQLMAIRPILVDFKYIYLLVLASYKKFQSLSIGSTVPGIGRRDILDFSLGLPPLAEQKRIVAKCDRLMSLCDTLEAKLKEARSHSETLMEVAAKQVLIA